MITSTAMDLPFNPSFGVWPRFDAHKAKGQSESSFDLVELKMLYVGLLYMRGQDGTLKASGQFNLCV